MIQLDTDFESLEKYIAKVIQDETGWYNGWYASEYSFKETSHVASERIIKYLKRKRVRDFKNLVSEMSSESKSRIQQKTLELLLEKEKEEKHV